MEEIEHLDLLLCAGPTALLRCREGYPKRGERLADVFGRTALDDSLAFRLVALHARVLDGIEPRIAVADALGGRTLPTAR